MTDKREHLVRLLIDRTSAGALDWKMVDPNAAEVEIGQSTVLIRPVDRSDREEKDIYVDIYNDGVLVESFSDVDLFRDTQEAWYPEMVRLLKSARRSAVGADRVMDEILSSLKNS